jgi:hypothetical protein
VSFSDVVVLEVFAVMPAGSLPDAIAHLKGVQPPLAFIAAEYGVPTVSLGREVVVIAMFPKHGAPTNRRTKNSKGLTPHVAKPMQILYSHRGSKPARWIFPTAMKSVTSVERHRGFQTDWFVVRDLKSICESS